MARFTIHIEYVSWLRCTPDPLTGKNSLVGDFRKHGNTWDLSFRKNIVNRLMEIMVWIWLQTNHYLETNVFYKIVCLNAGPVLPLLVHKPLRPLVRHPYLAMYDCNTGNPCAWPVRGKESEAVDACVYLTGACERGVREQPANCQCARKLTFGQTSNPKEEIYVRLQI